MTIVNGMRFIALFTYISLVIKHTILNIFSFATWLFVHQIGETITQILNYIPVFF